MEMPMADWGVHAHTYEIKKMEMPMADWGVHAPTNGIH